MLNIKISADFRKIDIERAYSVMFDAIRAATEVYYATLIEEIPHDSGFLSRSFNPLRRYTGSNVGLPTLSSRTTYNHSRSVKVRRTATNAEYFTKFSFSRRKDNFGVTYTNDIVYFLVNDIYGHPSGKYAPWRINEKAFKRAIDHLQNELSSRLDRFVELSLNATGGAQLSSRRV